MKFRFPDKPIAQMHRDGLDKLPSSFMAQLKMDGWRCVIEVGEWGPVFTSRHKKPIPISDELRNRFWLAAFRSLPYGTILDAEWCARRPGARAVSLEESLTVFDIMQLGAGELWRQSTQERFRVLQDVIPADWIVPHATADYAEFFDRMQLEHPEAEGIVLKQLDAPYIGSVRECAVNPGWIKAKWRTGEDGCTVLESIKTPTENQSCQNPTVTQTAN